MTSPFVTLWPSLKNSVLMIPETGALSVTSKNGSVMPEMRGNSAA